MGMFPKKVIGSSSESNASITFVVTVLQMLAPAYQLSAHDQLAQAYQLDNSQVTAGQTCILFFSARLSETLYISQPLQRLSSAAAASERPQNESQNIL